MTKDSVFKYALSSLISVIFSITSVAQSPSLFPAVSDGHGEDILQIDEVCLRIANDRELISDENPAAQGLRVDRWHQTVLKSEHRLHPILPNLKNDEDSLSSLRLKRKKPVLLPEEMSLIETVLWAEEGLFRKWGWAELTPEARKSELEFRRTSLSLHQVSGLLTLALFAPTLYFGQQRINELNRIDTDPNFFPGRSNLSLHRAFATATVTAYALTGLLSLISPPPLIRRSEWSTIDTHKALAWLHVAGMIAAPILIKLSQNAESPDARRSLRTAHQVTGYVTAGVLSLSMIVITF